MTAEEIAIVIDDHATEHHTVVSQDVVGYVDDKSPFAGLILGIQSIVATAWWVIIMFFWVKNATNNTMVNVANVETIPLGWWWERIDPANGQENVYIALSLMFNWIFYMCVSLIEMIAWAVWMTGTNDGGFARFYFGTVGYWGTIVAYFMPFLLSLIQVTVTFGGSVSAFPGAYTVWVMIMQLLLWLACAGIHIFYVPDFEAWLDRAWIVPTKIVEDVVVVHTLPVVVEEVIVEREAADESGEGWL